MLNSKKSFGSTSSLSRLPVRISSSHELIQEKRESRVTARNDTTKLAKARASSTSRSSSCLSVDRPTFPRSRSSASLRRTPQHTQQQALTGSRNKSAERLRIIKSDTRPIQDKKWQAEETNKTQEYLQMNPDTKSLLNKGTYLRPMTINLFVQLMNHLLQEIEPDIEEVTMANYVELIPNLLSMLMYPSPISASVLKTVNTMHSWPQVLAMLSWLVNFNILIISIPSMFDISPDASAEDKLEQLGMQIMCDIYARWNTGQTFDDLILKYKEEGRKYLKAETEHVKLVRNKIEQAKQELLVAEGHLQEKKKTIEVIQADMMTLTKDYENTKEAFLQQKEHKDFLTKCIKDINECKTQLKEEIEKVCRSCNNIKKQIKTQPASKDEQDQILKEIEELENKKKLLLQKNAHKQTLSDESDLKLSQLKAAVEEKVNHFNMALIKPSLEHEELKELAFPERGFLHPNVLEDIQEKGRKIQKLSANLDEEIKNYETEQKECNKKIKELHQKTDLALALLQKAKSEYSLTKEKLEKQEKDAENEANGLREEIENIKKQNTEIINSIPEIEIKKMELRKCKDKVKEWDEKIEGAKQESLMFFKSLRENIDGNIPPLDEMMKKITRSMDEALTFFKNPYKTNSS